MMERMKTCIASCIVSLCIFCGPNECSRDVFRSSPEFMDVSVRKKDLWNVIPQYEDLGACAKKCALFTDCQSFSYNHITKDCRGHSEVFDVYSGDFISERGAQYYYNEDPITTTPSPTTTKKSIGKGKVDSQEITTFASNVSEAEQLALTSTYQVPETSTTSQVPVTSTTSQVPVTSTTSQVPVTSTTSQVPETSTTAQVPETSSP